MASPKGIPKHLRNLENRLNETISEVFPRAEFNAHRIPGQQRRRIALLPEHSQAFHRDWNRLDDRRRSAACCFEWARLQIFMAVHVLPILRRSKLDFHHVTVVDKRWRIAPGSADGQCFDRPRRKVRGAIELLRREGYSPVHIAAYELSGDRSLKGDYSFEPHVHLLIGGVPKAALQIAFDVRQPRSERGRHKPVRAPQIGESQLQNILSYLTKMKAQDRVEYLRSNGKTNRISNRMAPAEEVEWLRCMATVPITHMIQFGGFAEPITSRFAHREMATMLGEMK
ncbi:hypothetical protein HJA76_01235 [Rhizobium bangladeshense]|uniref:hypothetical protein n=1 Tax=Rhizobium bangladeshense TaxID=1138189 RepID=UPI001C83603E|nr:hypothetical protein [Rhizobium bangladeshense]MBX4918354.1 hypothetical protein [Rhizobium bangladeshense]